MNVRHICLYLSARIGRWNDLRRIRHPRGTPFLWRPIDHLSIRLWRTANR